VVQPAALPATAAADLLLEPRLRAALQGQPGDCPDFDPQQPLAAPLRLSPTTWLVSQPCFRAAYQTASRLWLVDDQAPHRAQAVRLPAPDGDDGRDGGDGMVLLQRIAAEQGRLLVTESAKGRGIGDCESVREWTWTDAGFALLSATQSACKAFDAGGLPITLWRTRLR
jgi:hypothetical protein